MAAPDFERRKKNILGTSEKINHRVDSFPQICCSGYLTRCSPDISNEGFRPKRRECHRRQRGPSLNPFCNIYWL